MTESSGGGAFRKSDATLSISECVESCAATDGFDLLQSLAWHMIILALSVESISSSRSVRRRVALNSTCLIDYSHSSLRHPQSLLRFSLFICLKAQSTGLFPSAIK